MSFPFCFLFSKLCCILWSLLQQFSCYCCTSLKPKAVVLFPKFMGHLPARWSKVNLCLNQHPLFLLSCWNGTYFHSTASVTSTGCRSAFVKIYQFLEIVHVSSVFSELFIVTDSSAFPKRNEVLYCGTLLDMTYSWNTFSAISMPDQALVGQSVNFFSPPRVRSPQHPNIQVKVIISCQEPSLCKQCIFCQSLQFVTLQWMHFRSLSEFFLCCRKCGMFFSLTVSSFEHLIPGIQSCQITGF